ncbi:hypothetical protein [Halostagnicola sp. A-GB9-2]|uniref:hypothetical protein n=1 Tax=Halostagnicola sp. A-GB9-2 TaxID=3048066 RepID=UPI0024BF75D7|nr:hypothetical protein [Halostagnicola sp. A-GB9-2]MDJ1430598.1 hypothetical protein [Halostagnicola sp. A-GB9-2]
MKQSPLRGALLVMVGVLAAFIAVPLATGESVRIGTVIGTALGCLVLPVLAYHPGPLEERTAIVGGALLTVVLVSAALWLHV